MSTPTFAFLALTSGSYEGAIIRDMRLANELHARGYKTHVWWMMETNRDLVSPGIPQRVLCPGTRFQFSRPSRLMELAGSALSIFPDAQRRRFAQRAGYVDRVMRNLVRTVIDGDPRLEDRLEHWIIREQITHLFPTFAFICPFAQRVKARGKAKFDYLVTFQGEEIFANYAEQIGRLKNYYAMLQNAVNTSPWPAVSVSRDYISRLGEEMGINTARLKPIYPGIELPPVETKPGFAPLRNALPDLNPELPIVTFFGRQDTEKGIDLLLYAVKLLQEQGVQMQLVACGGSSFGLKYREICEQIAGHLRVRVYWRRRVSDEVRAALYAHSRCIVYPSIHREPFGMVAPEAMSYGTPVLVPNHGGITEAIRTSGTGPAGGLTFKIWDTADLAAQLKRLLTDESLHAQLVQNCRAVAESFSVQVMTDQVLNHLGIAPPSLVPSPRTRPVGLE
jgi:glycosyltransferase involved in cell wall biosynthesis